MIWFIWNLELCQHEGDRNTLVHRRKTNYGNILVVGNIHESWWSLDYGTEDTNHNILCRQDSPIKRKRHDYFKHSLPSGLGERKETSSSSFWIPPHFSSPIQILKAHKTISVDSLRVFTSNPCQGCDSVWALTSPLLWPVSRLRWPQGILGLWPPVLRPAALSR